jgi:hypothetical protein
MTELRERDDRSTVKALGPIKKHLEREVYH